MMVRRKSRVCSNSIHHVDGKRSNFIHNIDLYSKLKTKNFKHQLPLTQTLTIKSPLTKMHASNSKQQCTLPIFIPPAWTPGIPSQQNFRPLIRQSPRHNPP
jgi:hypothetical protein